MNSEQATIVYLENEASDDCFIKSKNKNELATFNSSHGMINRISDLLNGTDLFLEYKNVNGTDTIIAKKIILYVIPSGETNPTELNLDRITATIELTNGQKFSGEINLGGKNKAKLLFESKNFIPMIQININRTLLINRDNIKKIDIMKNKGN